MFLCPGILHIDAVAVTLAGKWSRDIDEYVEWSFHRDLWVKMHYFGQKLEDENAQEENMQSFHSGTSSHSSHTLSPRNNSQSLREGWTPRQLQGPPKETETTQANSFRRDNTGVRQTRELNHHPQSPTGDRGQRICTHILFPSEETSQTRLPLFLLPPHTGTKYSADTLVSSERYS